VEFAYYSNPKSTTSWFDKELCDYCAGSSGAKGFVEEQLTIEWKSVLPICKDCHADGAIPLARIKRRNGSANAKRGQRDRLIVADVPQANVDVVYPLEATDTPPTTTPIAPRATKRGRHVNSERSGKHPRRRLPRGVRG